MLWMAAQPTRRLSQVRAMILNRRVRHAFDCGDYGKTTFIRVNVLFRLLERRDARIMQALRCSIAKERSPPVGPTRQRPGGDVSAGNIRRRQFVFQCSDST